MRKAQICFAVVATVLVLVSCASGPQFKLTALEKGEARLTDIQMPEYVREDIPYDVVLTIESEETPQVTRVCFRWLTAEISTYSPSLYCYAMNGTFGSGPCGTWSSENSPGSSPFCREVTNANTEVPGRITVRITPTDLKASYNMLEGQVEYVSNGQARLTNTVRAQVKVEK